MQDVREAGHPEGAAYLSEDGRAERYWAEPRPRGRAVAASRLGRG